MDYDYSNRYSRRRGRGGIFFAAVLVFVFSICLFVGIFWWNSRAAETFTRNTSYYFLVRSCEDTTASAVVGEVYFSGGAGYLLEDGKAVVLACYFSEETANSVREGLQEKGVETQILKRTLGEIELNGDVAEAKKRIAANVETLETCALILYDTANALERTEYGQEEARVALSGVLKVIKGLREENAAIATLYDVWNAELLRAERKAIEIYSGILFAKDIRYLQVQLCFTVLNLNRYF